MAVLTSIEGDTIELIVFRHYERQDAALLQSVLDDPANKSLSDSGPVLPIGTKVTMPAIAADDGTAPGTIAPAVSLWD